MDLHARFMNYWEKVSAYNHAIGILYYDSETAMPQGGVQRMGKTLAVLSEDLYKMMTAKKFTDLIAQILTAQEGIDPVVRRSCELLDEEIHRIACIPMQEYVAYQVAGSAAAAAWRQAKHANDFSLFAPHLEKMVEYARRFALYDKPDADPYDTLLNQHEKGFTQTELDAYFADIRQKLVPLIHKIAKKEQPEYAFIDDSYPVHIQRQFSEQLLAMLCIDRANCAIGETEHPFTCEFSKHDVRMTTHYHENALLSSLYSVIHEGGHALYELHTGDELMGTNLASGASMGMHEAQSRFFENIIGRSEAFAGVLLEKVRESFPQQLAGVTPNQFYRAVNIVQPSLIRTEADELTYSMHIMVRYALEKQLIAGTLQVCDLPAAWNALYKEFLGVEVSSDTQGCLQDTHWSGGSFGYFPTYSIGSAYAAQIYAAMVRDLDVEALERAGNLAPVIGWLTEHIFKHGKSMEAKEILERTCGAPFSPVYYTDYLTGKFSALYGE